MKKKKLQKQLNAARELNMEVRHSRRVLRDEKRELQTMLNYAVHLLEKMDEGFAWVQDPEALKEDVREFLRTGQVPTTDEPKVHTRPHTASKASPDPGALAPVDDVPMRQPNLMDSWPDRSEGDE